MRVGACPLCLCALHSRGNLFSNPLPPSIDTKEEDLTHPEDIAHFAKHDREEEEQERFEQAYKQAVIESNIPQKFRRNPAQPGS